MVSSPTPKAASVTLSRTINSNSILLPDKPVPSLHQVGRCAPTALWLSLDPPSSTLARVEISPTCTTSLSPSTASLSSSMFSLAAPPAVLGRSPMDNQLPLQPSQPSLKSPMDSHKASLLSLPLLKSAMVNCKVPQLSHRSPMASFKFPLASLSLKSAMAKFRLSQHKPQLDLQSLRYVRQD